MKPIIGNAARKEQFFPRPAIRAKILEAIGNNQNLLISSPRRVGKTSILLNLIDEPDENYYAVFVNTEACNSSGMFFENILSAILDSDRVEGFGKFSKDVKGVFRTWAEKVASISIAGVGVTLNASAKSTYFDQLQLFLKDIKLSGKKIVLLIDEFPVTVEHILREEGEEKARYFLNQNRELRQNVAFKDKIQFVYTGSVGLLNVARKLQATDRVNDLEEITVGPLKRNDAQQMAAALFTTRFGYDAPPETINYLLDKIGLLLPFYIQLIVREVYDKVEMEEVELTETTMDAAFTNLIRNGNIHLQHYKDRLGKIFTPEEQTLVHTLLGHIQKSRKKVKYSDLLNLAVAVNLQDRLSDILETLMHDGYLIQKDDVYEFYSIILKHWWK